MTNKEGKCLYAGCPISGGFIGRCGFAGVVLRLTKGRDCGSLEPRRSWNGLLRVDDVWEFANPWGLVVVRPQQTKCSSKTGALVPHRRIQAMRLGNIDSRLSSRAKVMEWYHCLQTPYLAISPASPGFQVKIARHPRKSFLVGTLSSRHHQASALVARTSTHLTVPPIAMPAALSLQL